MFCDNPGRHFPYARIEVVHFGDDTGGDLIEENVFNGPLEQQLRLAIDHISALATAHLVKVPGQLETQRFVSYPNNAVREAIVNAVIHRGYDFPPEPIKVCFYPDRLEITSYPGPVQGFDRRHLDPGAHPPLPPARNRRISELFKELHLAELRGTGIPKIRTNMADNGSPEPKFDFDDARTYFRVTLPAHPGYVVLHAIRQSAQLWHTGERDRALARLIEMRKKIPQSGALAGQLIEYSAAAGDLSLARKVLVELEQTKGAGERHIAYAALARAFLDSGQTDEARALLKNVPIPSSASAAVELAILHKRSERFESAHKIFASVASSIQNDPKALHEFAQTKIKLASQIRIHGPAGRDSKRHMNREAAELLRRVVSLAPDQPTRLAWAWFDLARTMAWLREPETEVIRACEKAIEIEPTEPRFREWLDNRTTKAKGSDK